MADGIVRKNEEAIVFATNVDFQIEEDILWELFTQTGPVVSVFLPKDKITKDHKGFAFIEFRNEVDAEYTIKVLQGVKLHGKALKLSQANPQQKIHEIGANVFIGNLDPSISEQQIYDSFSSFGPITSCKILRDTNTGLSKGVALVSFNSFESSDQAIKTMNGRYFANKIIKVDYSYKRDSRGQQYGTAAERLLAANRPIGDSNSSINGSEIHIPEFLKN